MSRIFSSPVFKIVLAVGIVALLVGFNRLDVSALVELVHTWPWLVASFLVMMPTFVVVSYRFKLVLRSQDIHVPFIQAMRWTMIGAFFDLTMPSSSGGDLIKTGYVINHVRLGKKTRAVMTVVFDRVFGLLGLFLLVVVASALGWNLLRELPSRDMIMTLALTVCVVTLLLLRVAGARRIYHSAFLEKILSRNRWGLPLKEFIASFNALRERPRELCLIFGCSIINHIFWCLSLFCIVKALGLSVDFGAGFVVFPLAIFSNIFGIAGGFGGGTAGFDLVFSQLLDISNGALVGLVFQTLSALARLAGLPFYILSPRVEEDVKHLEANVNGET